MRERLLGPGSVPHHHPEALPQGGASAFSSELDPSEFERLAEEALLRRLGFEGESGGAEESSLGGGQGPPETTCAEITERPPWEESEEKWAELIQELHEEWRSRTVRVRGRTELAAWWAEEKRKAVEECGRRATLVVRSCGARQAVVHRCHSLLCPRCSRIDLWAKIRPYEEDIKRRLREREEVRARFLTLTGPGLVESSVLHFRVSLLRRAMRRFLDTRLGPRALKRLERLFFEVLGETNLTEEQKRRQVGLWEEFKRKVEEHRERLGKNSVMLREIIEGGLARLEIKWKGYDEGNNGMWHPHWHILLLTDFPIPQVLLSILWTQAFYGKFHRESILNTHIEEVKDPDRCMAYVAKYLVKGGEAGGEADIRNIEDIDKEAFLYAVLYTRKISVWKLERGEREKKCPACGNTRCGVASIEKSGVRLETCAWELERGEVTEWVEVEGEERGLVMRVGTWLAWGYSESDLPDLPPPEEEEPEGWREWILEAEEMMEMARGRGFWGLEEEREEEAEPPEGLEEFTRL